MRCIFCEFADPIYTELRMMTNHAALGHKPDLTETKIIRDVYASNLFGPAPGPETGEDAGPDTISHKPAMTPTAPKC